MELAKRPAPVMPPTMDADVEFLTEDEMILDVSFVDGTDFWPLMDERLHAALAHVASPDDTQQGSGGARWTIDLL